MLYNPINFFILNWYKQRNLRLFNILTLDLLINYTIHNNSVLFKLQRSPSFQLIHIDYSLQFKFRAFIHLYAEFHKYRGIFA